LISSTREYIIAEATRSLSLETGFPEDDEGDELWFGNASMPRDQGISYSALNPPQYVATDTRGRKHATDALIIPDLREHPDFTNHPLAGNGATFYAGVPLVSRSGHHIGVYALVDDKPRSGISRADLIFMQEMARVIQAHIEMVYNDAARHRGEKLVMGLGSFMRGLTSVPASDGDGSRANLREGNPDPSFQDVARQFKGMAVTDADPSALREVQNSRMDDTPAVTPQPDDVGSRQDPKSPGSAADTKYAASAAVLNPHDDLTAASVRPSAVHRLFGRAANILRQCTLADGVVFFDAVAVNLTSAQGSHFPHKSISSSDKNKSDSLSASSDNLDYTSGSAESEGTLTGHKRQKTAKQTCGILGSSLDVSISSTANVGTIQSLGVTDRVLRRFIRRYPKGKVFCFTAEGDISASSGAGDSSDSSGIAKTERTIATELIQAMPGARSVLWMPLYNHNKSRWCAGTFLWSRLDHALLPAQDDLAYLQTFGNSIMMSLMRLDAKASEDAKSTFIANISHELRSPLHGILGSTEFLQETALDGFQSSMARAVETCAKTLLDTVEHVLDYSKINQLSSESSRKQRRRLLRRTTSEDAAAQKVSAASLVRDVDLANVVEEAVEAVFTGFGYKYDMEHASSTTSGHASAKTKSANVRVLLDIEKNDDWHVQTEPGGIRRVLMNIVGNALKYTNEGSIAISMTGHDEYDGEKRYKAVCFKVRDTGHGMSKAFLRDHAFTPFSQESYLSVGTGLGLSIVRQIVDSLHGRIDIDSEKGVGTEVTVHLSLPQLSLSPSTSGHDDVLKDVQTRTQGKTACMLIPSSYEPTAKEGDATPVQSSLHKLATSWFGMSTTEAATMTDQKADFFIYPEPPPISHLIEHHGHSRTDKEVPLIILTTNAFESAELASQGVSRLSELGRVIEIISQPCGPHKFASALHRCLSRLDTLDDSRPNQAASDETVNEHVQDHNSQPQSANSATAKDAVDRPVTPPAAKAPTTKASPRRPRLANRQTEGVSIDIDTTTRSTELNSTEKRHSLSAGSTPAWSANPSSPMSQTRGTQNSNDVSPVLVVDDNHVNLQLLMAFVKKSGRPYATAADGLQAVQTYESALHDTPQTKPFQYVVMDISMPVVSYFPRIPDAFVSLRNSIVPPTPSFTSCSCPDPS
jgi:signal transduction histidine kinase